MVRQFINKNWRIYLLLVFTIFCCSYCSAQNERNNFVKYDSLTQLYVHPLADEMPKYKDKHMTFLSDFLDHFQYDPTSEEQIQTTLKLQFVIDKKGNLIGARIRDKTNDQYTSFEKAGWQPGVFNGEAVNVLISEAIHIHLQY